MMSTTEIRNLSARAHRAASRARKSPLLVESDDLLGSNEQLEAHLAHMPFTGGYKPSGWRKVALAKAHGLSPKARNFDHLFVDRSGWGVPAEPALTTAEFLQAVRVLGPGHGYAVVEMSQFQMCIEVYRPGVA